MINGISQLNSAQLNTVQPNTEQQNSALLALK